VSEFDRVFWRRDLDDLELLAIEHRRERLEWAPANSGHQYQRTFFQHLPSTTFTDSHINYTA
jgi:hypothetical protein